MEQGLKVSIERLLELYDKDGRDGYSAFSIDPNESENVKDVCEAIENLRRYVNG